MKSIVKFSTSIATAAIALAAFTPATFASTNVVVSRSGAFSFTGVGVNNTVHNTAVQTNGSFVVNGVTSKANSGKNSAAFNTGGNTNIGTGPAMSGVGIVNGGSTNTMAPSTCGCGSLGDTNVAALGNGAFSFTGVTVNNTSTTVKSQSNSTFVSNSVSSTANSGGNSASFNTGGNTNIGTGPATSSVGITNTGSSNSM